MKSFVFLLALVLFAGPPLRAADGAPPPVADPDAIPRVAATDRDALMGMEGRVVTVFGTLIRVGSTPSGSVTFLNFSEDENGFVAVVLERERGDLPKNFDDLVGKPIELIGTISIYKDQTPQIALGSPGQINVVPDKPE